MKSTMKRALSLILTALMLLMLLPGGMAEEMNTASAPVIPGLSDGGALVSEVLGESAEKTAAELLYDRLMACETIDEINAMLDGLTEEEEVAMDAFTEEQQSALMEKLAKLGYYDTASLKTYEVTIDVTSTAANKMVEVDLNGVTDATCVNVWEDRGITATLSGGIVTITVEKNSHPGTFQIYIVTEDATDNRKQTVHTVLIKIINSNENASQPAIEQYCYNGDNTVAYDVVSGGSGLNDTSKKYISSVTLASKNVSQADSNKKWGLQATPWNAGTSDPHTESGISRYNPSNADWTWNRPYIKYEQMGEKLSNYYGAEQSVTLEIKPSNGYYVTRVYITCSNAGTPLSCHVLKEDLSYDQGFTLETGREVSVTVSQEWFGHCSYAYGERENEYSNFMSKSGWYQYFILIEVAKIPTPMYVEYDYGDIVANGANGQIFNDADAWTTGGNDNAYGTTIEPDTNYTQYKYTYNQPADSAQWKHSANMITNEAVKAAAAAGYKFTGWKATYYSACTVSNTGNTKGGKYTYTFSNAAFSGKEFTYDAGDAVPLFTHVKLVAQWEKFDGSVILKKNVTGNMGAWDKYFDFTVEVKTSEGYPINSFTITDKNGKQLEQIDGKYSFKHDDVLTISGVPLGGTVTITETPDGYTPSATINSTSAGTKLDNNDFQVTYSNVAEGATITFTNTKSATPDTGVLLDSLPYLLILAVVVIVIVLSILRKRRNDD